MADAYPLQWPAGWARTTWGKRKKAKFQSSFASARDDLIHEIKLLGGIQVVLSTNVPPLRQDGRPRGGQRNPDDPGVAVYWTKVAWKNGILTSTPFVLACDRWQKAEDNIRALGLTIGALRGLERWGASSVMERAFTGFEALPPPPRAEPDEPWWDVLSVSQTATVDECRNRRRILARVFHPDNGTDPDAAMMAKINAAVDRRERTSV